METFLWSLGGVVVLVILSGIKVVKEYERGVIFRLGRLVGARGPGLFYVIPVIEQMVKIELRVITYDVPQQEVITRDNVTIRVNAVLYFRVHDPEAAIVQVQDFMRATAQIAQTTMRSVIGESELDEVLAERDKINDTLQRIIDDHTDPWGIKVTAVEVKDVELPEEMRRAIARQAEAERERRAKIIAAEGEFQASKRLSEAADIIGAHPPALQLRFLQTLVEISAEKASTVVFPLPMELFEVMQALTSGLARLSGDEGEQPE
ncbi:MAG: slipin family protein [Armatimonadota bacterium]|nr:slipin family protein [Armatimonadota bacterium]